MLSTSGALDAGWAARLPCLAARLLACRAPRCLCLAASLLYTPGAGALRRQALQEGSPACRHSLS